MEKAPRKNPMMQNCRDNPEGADYPDNKVVCYKDNNVMIRFGGSK